MYLGASLDKVKTKGGTKCLSMSSKKYAKAAVVNLEANLAIRHMQLHTSHSPMPQNYFPSEDVSNKLNTQEVQEYQERIGVLRWAFKIG